MLVNRPKAGLAAVIVAAGLVGSSPTEAAGSDFGGVRGVLKKAYAADSRTEDDVVRELVSLGPGTIPALFELYLGEGWEDLFAGEEEVDLEEWWCPPDRFHELFLQALGRSHAKRVVEHLDEAADDEAPHETRLAAVRVLGALGTADALEPLFRLGETFGTLALRYRSVQSPLENAFATVFTNDAPVAARELREITDDASDDVLTVVATAAARSGRSEVLPLFAELVRRGGDLGLHALETLPEFVMRAPWRFDDAPGDIAAGHLASEDWRYRRAAAFAVGRMGHTEAFGRIVLLLDDDHQAVSSAARWALETMASVDHPETSTEWLDWYDDQVAWWNGNRDELFDGLHSQDAHAVGNALRTFFARPLFRDEAARELASYLDSSDEALVLAAIHGLQELRSKHVVPDLVWLVDSRNDRIRKAANQALGRLTGAELPADRNAWRAFVEG